MDSELERLSAQLLGHAHKPLDVPQKNANPQITEERIAEIVDASIKKAIPELMAMVQIIDVFFDKALPPAELAAFKKYRDAGAPGLKELLASDKLYPVAQLLWDEIKGGLK